MTLLFFSAACDFCEGTVEPRYFRGFVIYRGAGDGQVHEEYVFRSAADAERWRRLMGLSAYEVRPVHSERPFRWRRSSGSVKGLELADHLFSIYPDRRYEPGLFRAHLA
jgi:hypothetical protein